jgi:hypothetical protein
MCESLRGRNDERTRRPSTAPGFRSPCASPTDRARAPRRNADALRASPGPCARPVQRSPPPPFPARRCPARPVPATRPRMAFCEVEVTLSPSPGSLVGAVYQLPQTGTGRPSASGAAPPATSLQAAGGLSRGYAVIPTTWPRAPMAPTGRRNQGATSRTSRHHRPDRATHVATVAGKDVVARYNDPFGTVPGGVAPQVDGGPPGCGGPGDFDGADRRRARLLAARYSGTMLRVQAFTFAPRAICGEQVHSSEGGLAACAPRQRPTAS